MEYEKIMPIAQGILEQLKPHCERIEIAGSLRRHNKEDYGDIEILAIPKPYNVGFLSSGIAPILEQWECIKGQLPCKFTQRRLPEGINLDFFTSLPDSWGLQYLIRTGPWEFSKKFVGTWLPKKGYHSDEGVLYRGIGINRVPVAVREEADMFRLAEIDFIPPEKRF